MVIILGFIAAPVIYAARKLPWVPVPVAPPGILASLLFSWVGLAVVVMIFIKDAAIYRKVLDNRAAVRAASSAQS